MRRRHAGERIGDGVRLNPRQDGPVYRLPPVHVVADRESALACIEHEEQRERARAAQATSAGKPNV